jgi:hypothetical protein
VKSLYALLLHLFPRAYQDEYGEELRTVFDLSFDEAMQEGWAEVAGFISRELLDLPKAIIHEHLRERRKAHMVRKFGSYFDFTYGSRWEFLTALYPFILVGFVEPLMIVLVMSNLLTSQSVLVNGIGVFVVASLGILLLIGLAKGLPRWSLPYLGFALTILSVSCFSALLDMRSLRLYDRLSPLGDSMVEGGWWFGLLVAMILLMMGARTLPAFQRFRNDWTLLCFIPYGGVPFALMLTFDAYTGDEPFMFFSFLVLASGTWLYLRNKHEWKRFGVLFGAMTLAMFIAAAGKVILLPTQDWLYYVDPASWKIEVMYTFNTWIWLALIMLLTSAPNLLSRSKSRLQTT